MLVKTYLIVIRDDVALLIKMKTSTFYFIKAEFTIIMFENKL